MRDLHRLLAEQLAEATGADGDVDVLAFLKGISRTYEQSGMPADNVSCRDHMATALESLHHGVIMVSEFGDVPICNNRACEILGLPHEFSAGTHSFGDLAMVMSAYPVEPESSRETAVLRVPGGRVAEVRVGPLVQGNRLILVEDTTADRARQRELIEAESQYRSLFENSVYGIYRDTLEGKPVRVSPALAAMNRYETEQEQIENVSKHMGSWYVDPRRAQEFMAMLKRDGRVHDFVSEVYRHRTKERLWVTENAWYVRDSDGNPLFIEGTVQDATERVAAQKAMTKLADFDQLTGATSRYRFMQAITHEVQRGEWPLVLYCIDLDLFKDINDAYGHATGDEVLKAVVRRFESLVDASDMVARLGGDEFAILSTSPANAEDPSELARRLVDAMRVAIPVEGTNHFIGASVGVALYPDHGTSAAELMKAADLALYEAKERGRNGWRMFDHELRSAVEKRKQIEAALRTAPQLNQLELHYQPIVEASNGRIVGFESLMRFNHPELGQIPPSEFIPIAEQSGLMTQLGAWAISRCCEAAAALVSASITVNVSANQFRAPGFLAHVQRELSRSGVEPERLTLEITETVLMSNETAAYNLLKSLRDLGVNIAIDDFGTGYSSLGYLRRLPISMVKVDRSFILGISEHRADMAVIRAILGIGRDMGIKVVAEGIETEAQRQTLLAEGCQFMQGYLFSMPVPLQEAAADYAIGLLPRAASLPPALRWVKN